MASPYGMAGNQPWSPKQFFLLFRVLECFDILNSDSSYKRYGKKDK